MPVGRDVIKLEVVDVLERVSQMAPIDDEAMTLANGLLLTGLMREALASTWTKISEAHGGSSVSRTASAKAKSVGDVIDLVHTRANKAPKA